MLEPTKARLEKKKRDKEARSTVLSRRSDVAAMERRRSHANYGKFYKHNSPAIQRQ